MNRYYTILILFFLTCFSDSLSAQKSGYPDAAFNEWKEFFDQSYGADYELINGIKYVYPFFNSSDHPFLGEDRFYTGYAVINGRQFPDLKLKFDICIQRIVLNHPFFSGEKEQIILNNEFIDAFELDGKLFRKYSFPETGIKFLQVIESGDLCCLYFWRKKFNDLPQSIQNANSFSPPKKKRYLLLNNEIWPFNTKRSFLKLFPEGYQKQINQFIRTNMIWSNEVPDKMMHQLINYCDNLIHPGEDSINDTLQANNPGEFDEPYPVSTNSLFEMGQGTSPDMQAQDLSRENEMVRSDLFREKIFLFTDRNIYAVNEKVFFRAFNLSESRLKQRNWSKILYVELISESNRAIARGKYELNTKGAWGYLNIPPSTAAGLYSIRAYTKWMRNYPPTGYFHKTVAIINPNGAGMNNIRMSTGEEFFSDLKNIGNSRNLVECNTDKSIYNKRGKIHLAISVPEKNNTSPDGYYVTVVKKGYYDTTIPELIFPSFKNTDLPEKIHYYPETRGLSLSGRITSDDGDKPFAYSQVHLTLLGNDPDYYGFLTDKTGGFRISLPYHKKTEDILFCVENKGDRMMNFSLDSDYSTDFLKQPEQFSGKQAINKKTVEEIMFNAQVVNIFKPIPNSNDPVEIPDTLNQYFYGSPELRIKTADYVLLSTLEEFFFELIQNVIVKKEKDKHYLYLTRDYSDLYLYIPLVLLDYVPVFDADKILDLSPENITSIDIVNSLYFRGNLQYGGIINIISSLGDRAGVDLPRNSFFFSFKTCESQQQITFPDYDKDPGDTRIPDYRNCLFWAPNISVGAGDTVSLDFFSSDLQGDYMVIVRGITDDGQLMHGECNFTVK